jgi:phospholipid/cholesterol/gamma-HCH transport system substrate-binding protein
MSRLRVLLRSKSLRLVVVAVVVVAAVVVGLKVTEGRATYHLNVVYASAPGLFPGAAVDVLGVPVGTVTSVTNVEDRVDVGMQVDDGARIPTAADASLVAPELLGQPDVDLNPGYTRGAYLRPDATIPETRTSVPVSTDQFLKQLQRSLNDLNPHAVGDLVANLAQDLDGQGAGLNQLIKGAAGTIQLLADKGDDLGQLNGTLAQLTGTLDGETSQIEQLAQEYDTVSTVVAQHSGQLNDAITQLAGSATALTSLLTPNLQPLEADVGTVTTVGRTLDRNIGNVDEVLQQGNNLFQGAARVYNPTYNWLDLNLALPPGVTGDYVAGLIRDRLAGVCRRLVANHSAGLSATELASLNSCGNPDSSFFDPLINEIPTILNNLSAADSSSAASAILQKGLSQIGSIGASSSTTAPSSTSATAGGTTSGAKAPSSSSPTTTTTKTPGSGSSCGLLGTILGCPSTSSSKSSAKQSDPSSTPSTSSSSTGVGGLLSQDVKQTASHPAAHLVSGTPATPSLTAADANLLPPLPSAHHHKKAHRALLAQWLHDVGSWL